MEAYVASATKARPGVTYLAEQFEKAGLAPADIVVARFEERLGRATGRYMEGMEREDVEAAHLGTSSKDIPHASDHGGGSVLENRNHIMHGPMFLNLETTPTKYLEVVAGLRTEPWHGRIWRPNAPTNHNLFIKNQIC